MTSVGLLSPLQQPVTGKTMSDRMWTMGQLRGAGRDVTLHPRRGSDGQLTIYYFLKLNYTKF